MYVFRVLLMYLLPFAAAALYYAMNYSLAWAEGVAIIMLGLVAWRRERDAALWRDAVKDIHGIIKEGRQS